MQWREEEEEEEEEEVSPHLFLTAVITHAPTLATSESFAADKVPSFWQKTGGGGGGGGGGRNRT